MFQQIMSGGGKEPIKNVKIIENVPLRATSLNGGMTNYTYGDTKVDKKYDYAIADVVGMVNGKLEKTTSLVGIQDDLSVLICISNWYTEPITNLQATLFLFDKA